MIEGPRMAKRLQRIPGTQAFPARQPTAAYCAAHRAAHQARPEPASRRRLAAAAVSG